MIKTIVAGMGTAVLLLVGLATLHTVSNRVTAGTPPAGLAAAPAGAVEPGLLGISGGEGTPTAIADPPSRAASPVAAGGCAAGQQSVCPAPVPPTGTPLSACGSIPTTGTYYLTANLSAAGTCFSFLANDIFLNLNGHT